MSEEKQYAERDICHLDDLGGYYMRHVMAMTSEDLHGKGAIAAELAWRDAKIDELAAKLQKFVGFAEKVSEQEPEAPDHWNTCGQCDRNIDLAQDLLERGDLC